MESIAVLALVVIAVCAVLVTRAALRFFGEPLVVTANVIFNSEVLELLPKRRKTRAKKEGISVQD